MAPKARQTTTIVTTTTTVVEHVGGKRGKKDDGDEKKVLKKPIVKFLPGSKRCEAVTGKGVQCKRIATCGAFCWQHKDEMDDEGESGDGDGDDDEDNEEPPTPEPKAPGHTGMTQEMENMGW
jgi:hypothetical protein